VGACACARARGGLPGVNSTSRALAGLIASAILNAAERSGRDFSTSDVRAALGLVVLSLGAEEDEQHDQREELT
jgi:hypothetical protein